MVTKFEALLSWIALPIYICQGLGVRRRSIRMEPPQAPAITEIKGKGKPLRILVLGDSSAAGVGVENFEECMAGRLPALLHQRTKRPVIVRTCGNNSATSGQIGDHVVPNLERSPYDYIVLNLGVNDAKNFHTGRRFCREFGTLIYALRARFPDAQIIWSGVLDLQGIPALPSPLNKILGIRSRIISRNGQILCRERGALAPQSNWKAVRENFSIDGFHASSEGYRIWAEQLAEYVVSLEEDS